MNSKQRFLAALDRRQPDRVPLFELWIDEPIRRDLARRLSLEAGGTAGESLLLQGEEDAEAVDLYCRLVEALGLDATCYDFSTGLEPVGGGYARDRYGARYLLSEHGEAVIVEGPIKESADVVKFEMAPKLRPDDFSRMRYVMDRLGPAYAHVMGVVDPFKVSWKMRGGMENLFLDYHLNPGLVHDLARMTTDYSLAAVEMAAQLGVDALILEGDLAGEHELLISPAHYREFVKPYEMEIVARAHSLGLRVVKHSDGDVWPILDDFVEAGFDAFHPVQPQSMDIAEVKAHLAGRACVIGNIDCRDLLVFGTPAEVTAAVKETIEKAAPGGGYILSSSNTIYPGCQAENYLALVEAAHAYGAYETAEAFTPDLPAV